MRKFSKGCQFPEPQPASPAATAAPAHRRRTAWHSWHSVLLILWLWVLAPAVIVFSTLLVVQLLPPSLYTTPSSTGCLVHGQEQACADVLNAAVAASAQEPPGWLQPVLRSKWFLQDCAARLLGSDASCGVAAAPSWSGTAGNGAVQLPEALGAPSRVAGTAQCDKSIQLQQAEHVQLHQERTCHAPAGYQPTCTVKPARDSGSDTGTDTNEKGVCQQRPESNSADAPAAVPPEVYSAQLATAAIQALKTISSARSTATSARGHAAALEEPTRLAQCPAQGHCPVDSRIVTMAAVHWADSQVYASTPWQLSMPGQRTTSEGWCMATTLHMQQPICPAPGSLKQAVEALASRSKGAMEEAAQPIQVGGLGP